MDSLKSQPIVLTDEPKWSSASLCVTLNHMGESFRPEYTHQLVKSECWWGHRPHASVLQKAYEEFEASRAEKPSATSTAESMAFSSKSILHKSHQHHEIAQNELDIRVKIAPSGKNCCVDIVRTKVNHASNADAEPDAKRQKIDLDSESQPNETKDPNLSIASWSTTSMPDSHIIKALSKALPPIVSIGDADIDDSFLSEPIGECLEEYSVPVAATATGPSAASLDFVLTLADGRQPMVSEYHSSVEKLSLFYIENADTVDVGKDGNGGFWKIMYIFQKHPIDGNASSDDAKNSTKTAYRYSLVGYFTLFHFIALFHKPEPGLILRVCQALILPSFQRQGHGKRLLQAVHNLAHQQAGATGDKSDEHKIIEVNVEDPAPAFVALRNKVGFDLVLKHHKEWNWPKHGSMWRDDDEQSNTLASPNELKAYFSAMTEKEASGISHKAKITPKQIHVMNELLRLAEVRSFLQGENVSNADREAVVRFFRLMVKRRLNKDHQNELLEQPTKDDQKALLGTLFDEEYKGYERILSKLPGP